ncbi:MAG TPA: flavodoxin domain-containing protein [Terracidiphilus sp.]|jgi:menaquinone-dependent protoporphyrinogen oxidase
MAAEILIAYCTRSGSTAEVAREMGRAVTDAGAVVSVKPMAEVQSIAYGQAVVLGGALYVGRFAGEAHRFIARFEQELGNGHPWIFVLGPTENDPKQFRVAEEQARKELAKFPWLHPVDVRVFGGKFDPKTLKLPFPFNLVMKFPGNPMSRVPATDIRDWDWIRSWAKAIVEHLNAVA